MSRPLEDSDGAFGDEVTDIGPACTVAAMEDEQVGVLRQAGGTGTARSAQRRGWLRALPIDPTLHRFLRSLEAGRAGRSRRSTSSRPMTRTRSPHAAARR